MAKAEDRRIPLAIPTMIVIRTSPPIVLEDIQIGKETTINMTIHYLTWERNNTKNHAAEAEVRLTYRLDVLTLPIPTMTVIRRNLQTVLDDTLTGKETTTNMTIHCLTWARINTKNRTVEAEGRRIHPLNMLALVIPTMIVIRTNPPIVLEGMQTRRGARKTMTIHFLTWKKNNTKNIRNSFINKISRSLSCNHHLNAINKNSRIFLRHIANSIWHLSMMTKKRQIDETTKMTIGKRKARRKGRDPAVEVDRLEERRIRIGMKWRTMTRSLHI
mmetsp:Transcript_20293/g.42454  ORF Transcript_20293/g.42454 Transcript_20293/m.42454 type:complete len:273 (+) Transcript_20293:111-929(+)